MKLPSFLTQDSDGEIRIAGHRIGLYTLATEFRNGQSAEHLAGEFPSLSLRMLCELRDFCVANQAEVDQYLASYQADLDRQADSPPGPGLLKIRGLMNTPSPSGKFLE